MVLQLYSTRTALVIYACTTATPLVICKHSTGTLLVLYWHCCCADEVLFVLGLILLCSPVQHLALGLYSTGPHTVLALYCTATAMAPGTATHAVLLPS